jgi:hypothetical protein
MRRVAKLVVGAMMFGGAVMAQPPASPTPTAPADQVDISAPRRAALSPQDMLNQGREYRAKMNEVVGRVQSRVEAARKQKDIIRVNCLLDKLAQVRGNLNIADQALQALSEAIGRADEGSSLHEYTRLTIVQQKVQVLETEAEACVGEDLSFVGATRVDVEVEGIPPGDFTQPTVPQTIPDRPPAASPSL